MWLDDEDLLGKRLAIAFVRPVVPVEIVGVVDDLQAFNLWTAPRPTAFSPHLQQPYNTMTLTVRTGGAPLASAPAVSGRFARSTKISRCRMSEA